MRDHTCQTRSLVLHGSALRWTALRWTALRWSIVALGGAALPTGCGNDTGGGATADTQVHNDGGVIDIADAADGDAASDAANDSSGDVAGDASADTAADSGGDASADAAVDAGGIPPGWVACNVPNDCVAVELGCCDHCNGGKLGGFHKDYAKQAKDALGEVCTPPIACTEMACGQAVATCQAGQCVAMADPGFGGACANLKPDVCAISKSCTVLSAGAPAHICANKPGPMTPLGCMPADQGCGAAETCAADPSGALWVFMSTCLPKDFVAQPWDKCCGGGGVCAQGGSPAELSKVCLQAKDPTKGLQPGEPFDVVVYPKGCMSSSCTKVHSASCSAAVDVGGALAVTGAICLSSTGGRVCTADCNGGGFASCQAPALSAGSYKASFGEIALSFDVPSKPGANLCASAQW